MLPTNPGSTPATLFSRAIRSKEDRIKHFVRRSGNIEFAILEVAFNIYAKLDAVLAVADGNHITVAVIMFLKELGISAYEPKPAVPSSK